MGNVPTIYHNQSPFNETSQLVHMLLLPNIQIGYSIGMIATTNIPFYFQWNKWMKGSPYASKWLYGDESMASKMLPYYNNDFLPVNCTSMITKFDDGMGSTALTLCRQLVYNIIKSKQNKKPSKNAMSKQDVCYDVCQWSHTRIVLLVLQQSHNVSLLRASSGREVHCLTHTW